MENSFVNRCSFHEQRLLLASSSWYRSKKWLEEDDEMQLSECTLTPMLFH